MENLLKRQISKLEEEELERKIQKELEDYINNDQSEKSFINPIDKSYISDQNNEENNVWQEFIKGNEERQQMLLKFEDNIKNLNKITNEFAHKSTIINIPIVNNLNKSIEKEPEFKNDDFFIGQNEEILENFNENQDFLIEKQNFSPEKPVEKPDFFLDFNKKKSINTNIDSYKTDEDKFISELEQYKMEKEDFYSKKLEIFLHQKQFENRLDKITNFPELKLPKIQDSINEDLSYIQLTSTFDIPPICSNTIKDKLEYNSPLVCLNKLNKIKNIKKNYIRIIENKENITQNEKIHLINNQKTNVVEIVLQENKEKKCYEQIYTEKINDLLLKLYEKSINSFKIPLIKPIRIDEFRYLNNNFLIEPSKNSLKQIVSLLNPLKIKNFQYNMENIDNIQGIEILEKINFISLSSNNIINANPLLNCKNLIEINLSQNKINGFNTEINLKNLRILNLELNFLIKIPILNTSLLEILLLNRNKIEKIENIDNCINLKKLSLYQNSIKNLFGIEKLIQLEELDLGRNCIETLISLENNQKLRKIILYNNFISKIDGNFDHFLLCELWLNNNRLIDINGLRILPCLYLLNLENNYIERIFTNEKIAFLPNLKYFNVSYNKLTSFISIFWLFYHNFYNRNMVFSINFKENPFVKELSEENFKFISNSFFILCKNLKEINGETNKKSIIFNKNNKNLNNYSYFSNFSQEYQFFNSLESNKFNFSLFYKTNQFIEKKNSLSNNHFMKINQFLINKKPDFYNENTIYYEKYLYDKFFFSKLKKISCFFKNHLLKKLEKKRYFSIITPKILKIQAFFRGFLVRKAKKNNKKSIKIEKIIKIQKNIRGFLLRTKKKKLFSNINYNIEDLPDIDFAFLEPKLDDFNLFIPKEYKEKTIIDFPNLPKKQKLPPLQENLIKNNDNFKENSDSISEISIKSVKKILPKIENNEKGKKIIEEWGFQKEELKEAFKMRLDKDRKRKELKNKKNLNAEERFKLFAKNKNKI